MIKKIKRSALDLDKYTACLQRAVNYRVYAEYWYLDSLTDLQWDCLVLNDYEAIMPLPYRKKLNIKYIAQPLYCQQLGVFHDQFFEQHLFDNFIHIIKRKLVHSYHFNEENTTQFNPQGTKKINQIIPFPSRNGYSKMVKRNLSKFRQQAIQIIEHHDVESYIEFKKKYSTHDLNETIFFQVLKSLQNENVLKIFKAVENDVISYAVLIHSKNRWIYLDGASSAVGKEMKASTGLIDFVINDLNTQNNIFDFEGSSIPSIHQFYANFGSHDVYYTKYSNLPFFKSP